MRRIKTTVFGIIAAAVLLSGSMTGCAAMKEVGEGIQKGLGDIWGQFFGDNTSPLEVLGGGSEEVGEGRFYGALAAAGIVAASKEIDHAETRRVVQVVGVLSALKVGEELGQLAKERRKEYETEKEFLDAEIELARQAVEARSKDVENTKQKLAETEAKVENLTGRAARNENITNELNAAIEVLNKEIEADALLLSEYQQAIGYIDIILQDLTKIEEGKTLTEEEQELQEQRDELLVERGKLAANYETLHGLTEMNLTAQDQLIALGGTATR